MKNHLIYNYLDDDELLRISNKIKEVEKTTAGEVCISIKEHTSLFDSRKSISILAKKEFFKRGINKTRDKTGILIFILLSKKQFYILADEGINNKVSKDTWEEIKNQMQNFFTAGNFCKGIILGIEKIGNILSLHFPIKPDDTNELSNSIAIS